MDDTRREIWIRILELLQESQAEPKPLTVDPETFQDPTNHRQN